MKRAILGVVLAALPAAGALSCYDLGDFAPTNEAASDGAVDGAPFTGNPMDAAPVMDATTDSAPRVDAAMDAGLTDATLTDAPPDQQTVDSAPPDASDAASPTLSLSSSAIDFGYVGCGEQASPLAIVITNTSSVSERITETLLDGGTFFSVQLETPGGPASTTTLAPAQTVTMLVSTFGVPSVSPVTPDYYRGTIALSVDPPLPSAVEIPVTETALGAILQLTPTVASFGLVEAGAAETFPFQLVNVGNATASVTFQSNGTGFSAPSLDGGLYVAEAGAASFSVQYSSSAAGASFGSLTLETSPLCGPIPSVALVAGAASILASAQDTPAGIAVDATNVYWTNSAYLDGVPGSLLKGAISTLADGGAPTTLVSGLSEPEAIVVDATNVYWADIGGALQSIPIAGGDAGTLVPNAGVSLGAAIALDSTNLYWLGSGNVMSVPKGGGTPVTLATGQTGGLSVAVDSTSIYWTSAGTGTGTGVIAKAPLSGVPDGGTPTTLASGLLGPSAIVVDATNVYWISDLDEGAAVMALPLSGAVDGGGPTVLASLPSGPLSDVAGLAVDSKNLYVACSSLLLAVPLAGGAPVTLATGSLFANVAQTDAGVYWTDALGFRTGGGAGVVMSIPK